MLTYANIDLKDATDGVLLADSEPSSINMADFLPRELVAGSGGGGFRRTDGNEGDTPNSVDFFRS